MKNVDHLDNVAPYSVKDAVWCFDQLANARPFISVNNTTEMGKCR